MSRVIPAADRAALLEPGFALPDAERAVREAILRHAPERDLPPLGETLEIDRRMALVDLMFLYFDKASMAASLEVRVPFMDHDVVAWCVGLPDSRKVWRTRRKEILKRAARGLIPDEIIDKPKRGFFRAAFGPWLRANRDGIVRETLLDERVRARGQLRPEALEALLAQSGDQGLKSAQRVLCLFLLERWQRVFVDPDGIGRRALAAPAVGP